MTPPIRIRRRWKPGFDPRRTYIGYRWPNDPWLYECAHWRCGVVARIGPRAFATQPAALAAGLAHLKTHTET